MRSCVLGLWRSCEVKIRGCGVRVVPEGEGEGEGGMVRSLEVRIC